MDQPYIIACHPDDAERIKAHLESMGITVITPTEVTMPEPQCNLEMCKAEPKREPFWCYRHNALKPCEECRGEAQLRQHQEHQQSCRANHFKRQPVPRTRSLPRTTQNR